MSKMGNRENRVLIRTPVGKRDRWTLEIRISLLGFTWAALGQAWPGPWTLFR